MRIRDVLCIACIVALLAAAGAFADNASRPFVGGADWQFVGESPPNVGLVSMLSGKSTHTVSPTPTGSSSGATGSPAAQDDSRRPSGAATGPRLRTPTAP